MMTDGFLLGLKRVSQGLTLRFKVFTVIAAALSAGAIAYLLLPKPDLANYQSYSTAVYDRNGQLLRISLAQDDRYRLYTPIKDIAEHLQRASILYEDQNYYQHTGVDYLALARAFWQTYVLRERRIGASTIVMQVARLRWDIPSNTLSGKIQQIFRALQLSRHYSKQALLEAYLNLAPYGGNIEGIGAASLIYFDKPASALSFAEAVTLAVVPQNPNVRNPSSVKGRATIKQAKQRLIERWSRFYPEEQQLLALAELPLFVRSAKELPYHAPHFVQYVLSQQTQALAMVSSNQPINKHVIKGTIDLKLQNRLEEVLQAFVVQNHHRGFTNASALLLNSKTMHIEAMIGSADFNNLSIQGQVNGTLAKRSPGSTLKPFVYGLAIDAGLIHPMSMLKDLPKKYAGFTPENFGRGFQGPVSAQDALIKSRNVPAVELQALLIETQALLAQQNGGKKILTFYDFLKAAGISQLREPDFYGLALALGGGEVSMLELVELYASISNLGEHKSAVSTYWGVSVATEKSREKAAPQSRSGILSFRYVKQKPKATLAICIFCHTVPSEEQQVAWKTGTSWAFRDAWAVAILGEHVLAVWLGNFDGQGNNAFIGRTAAGPLLFKLLDVVKQSGSPPFFDAKTDLESIGHLNLKWVDICQTTGDLYESACPNKGKTRFIPGVSPIKSTNIYRKIWVDNKTGLRRCDQYSEFATQKVFAFWSTDFLSLFAQAGVHIEKPPRFMSDCSQDDIVAQGNAPAISSPQQQVNYVVENSLHSSVSIPLQAAADAEANHLYWFSNGQFIGSTDLSITSNDRPLLWQATPGAYSVRVLDDLGRSSAVSVQVQAVN